MNRTRIEWLERDGEKGYSWNPASGCTPVSSGCARCYAKAMSKRLAGRCGYPADEPFKVTLHPEKLVQPLRRRKPSRIFTVSMGDLFHSHTPEWFIDKVFGVMAVTSRHTYILLTKRPERMQAYMSDPEAPLRIAKYMTLDVILAPRVVVDNPGDMGRWSREGAIDWPLPNVLLGTSAEDQSTADARIPHLLATPAAGRVVSLEPLLGPVDLTQAMYGPDRRGMSCFGFTDGIGQWDQETALIDGLFVGGETGPGARPVHPDWIRSLRDQAKAAGTAFCFKAWGAWVPGEATEIFNGRPGWCRFQNYDFSPSWEHQFDEKTVAMKVGKKAAGRELDGQVHDEFPELSGGY